MNDRLRRARRGAALVLTLLFVAVITVIVIGFVGLTQFEVASAWQHLGGIEADFYAREAEDIASGRIESALGNASLTWISQPGALYGSVTNFVPLYSGPPVQNGSADQEVDLNPESLVNSNENLIGTNSAMIVQWMYQFQDGSFVTQAANLPPPYNPANPVTGRFAFWVDDEGAKLNLNTANAKSTLNAPGNPAQVNLGTNAADATNILAYRNAIGNFNSVAELGRATNISTALLGQPFSLTTYNHSPAPRINLLGQQPILLTTQARVAAASGYTNFIDILTTPNTDPGQIADVDLAKVNNVVSEIISGLTNSNWPIMPGKSFQDKYPDVATLAANIIEYVRSAESTNFIVEPLRGVSILSPPSYQASQNFTNGVGALAMGRHPVICQMASFFPPAPYNQVAPAGQSNFYSPYMAMQIYYPQVAGGWNNNGAGVPLSLLQARVDIGLFYGPYDGGSYTFTQNSGAFTNEDYSSPSAINIMPGGYALIVNGHNHTESGDPSYPGLGPLPPDLTPAQVGAQTNSSGQPVTVQQINLGLMSLSGAMLSVLDNQTASIPMTSQVTTVSSWATGNPYTVAVDDPVANYWHAVWRNAPFVEMGSTNHTDYSTLGTVPSVSSIAQQDTGPDGKLVNGLIVPAPAGTPQNPYGMVQSLGELGFIHTGNSGAAQADVVPWRTIRLQPEKAGSTDLPDWLMLELFAVPSTNAVVAANRPFLQPNNIISGTTTNVYALGGQVNLNGQLLPFSNYPSRLLPLESVLTGISNNAVLADGNNTYTLAAANVPTTATNILGYVEANSTLGGISNQGRSFTNSVDPNNLYFSPGQVAEIAGVADSGESSEEMVRQLVGLTSVRSDVFTIYSVGQSLQQDRFGRLHILGESRRRSTVERIYSNGTTVQQQTVASQRLGP